MLTQLNVAYKFPFCHTSFAELGLNLLHGVEITWSTISQETFVGTFWHYDTGAQIFSGKEHASNFMYYSCIKRLLIKLKEKICI